MRALLVIDMQKEGVYDSYGAKSKLYRKKDTIENIRLLAERFHKSGDLVIQVKVWITDPRRSSMTKTYPGEGLASSPRSAIIDELKDLHYDHTIKKPNYTAFYDTSLDKILRRHKVKSVYLTGINTGFCVFCTALDAYYRGYDTFLVTDATSTVAGKRAHERGVQQFIDFCGKNTTTTKQLLK